MDNYIPCLLSRSKAMLFLGLTRRNLEKLATDGIIRVYKTKGGHKRYFRDDLKTILNEHNKKQHFHEVQS